ncbi:MAG TPA: cation diffusion facilitator family transporter [Xanthobacteraceae bacterium]|jgi:cation diffusion facilitator family transporter|nr:cation diffusion facilitator family transporter [Xanthobacteraceae bacterium]
MNEKEKAALGSIGASAGLTAAKAAVGLLSGSLAILSEAAHSLLDLAATLLTYFAVRISGKPADAEHQYGHGKVESVTALAETAFLFLLSAVVIFEAAQRLLGDRTYSVEATAVAFLVISISIVVDFFRARTLRRVAKKTSSQALEADALHFGSDMWSSIVVLIGLAGVALGYALADAVAAMVVAVFICMAGWRLGRRTIDTLTDTAPPGVSERAAAIARRVPGVVSIERVRARPGGAVFFVDLAVGVSRALPLDRVAAIKARLARAIRADMPEAEITITTEPRALDDETVRERVMLIARNSGLAVHHVAVQAIAGRLSVSADLEVEGTLTLAAAHDIASRLEEAIREELGPEVEVETHIEPLPAIVVAGRDAAAARVDEVRQVLAALGAGIADLGEVHDVRVRETAGGEIVNFHCRVDPGLSVAAVHDMVDGLERGLRRRFPTIARAIGHAEPRPR